MKPAERFLIDALLAAQHKQRIRLLASGRMIVHLNASKADIDGGTLKREQSD